VTRAKRGRLVALDGGAVNLMAAAKDVVRALAAKDISRGVSAWDASGVFTELFAAEGRVQPRPSARTLTLLYAADLAFRLRWQIVPALEDRRVVIAAPYVETAKALGVAVGLPRKWLDDLFRFAPRPDSSYVVPLSPAHAAASESYFNCFATTLHGSGTFEPAALRTRSLAYLASLEKRRRVVRLTRTALTTLSKHL
jgi:hypothetical protein